MGHVLPGSKGTSIIQKIFLWDNASIKTHLFELRSGRQGFVGVEVALKLHMDQVRCHIDVNGSPGVHVCVLAAAL